MTQCMPGGEPTGEQGAGSCVLSPEDRYADLVDELVAVEGVIPPQGGRGFGRSAVKFGGKIFVMLVRGTLVLKLPAGRVDELIAAGAGVRFDANKGTPMKEWLSLHPPGGQDAPGWRGGPDWLPLAREALEYAGWRG